MEWGSLTTVAIFMAVASLCIRWRFPTVHPALASAGIGGSLSGVALSFFHPTLALALSLALNFAFAGAMLDLRLRAPKPINDPEITSTDKVARTLLFLSEAKRKATNTMAHNYTQPECERTLPIIRAALLSANKQFGIPLMAESGEAALDLEAGRRLIEKILPFLQQGHIDEARQAGRDWIEKLGREVP